MSSSCVFINRLIQAFSQSVSCISLRHAFVFAYPGIALRECQRAQLHLGSSAPVHVCASLLITLGCLRQRRRPRPLQGHPHPSIQRRPQRRRLRKLACVRSPKTNLSAHHHHNHLVQNSSRRHPSPHSHSPIHPTSHANLREAKTSPPSTSAATSSATSPPPTPSKSTPATR
jgi:hypothetical protein